MSETTNNRKVSVFKGQGPALRSGKEGFTFEVFRIAKKEANEYGAYFYTCKIFKLTDFGKYGIKPNYEVGAWELDEFAQTVALAKDKIAELENSAVATEVTNAANATLSDGPPV